MLNALLPKDFFKILKVKLIVFSLLILSLAIAEVFFGFYMFIALIFFLLTGFIYLYVTVRKVLLSLDSLQLLLERIAGGDYTAPARMLGTNKLAVLLELANKMMVNIRDVAIERDKIAWLNEGIANLNLVMINTHDFNELAFKVIQYLVEYSDSNMGVIYLKDKNILNLTGYFESGAISHWPQYVEMDQGIIGKVAAEGKSCLIEAGSVGYADLLKDVKDLNSEVLSITPLIFKEQEIGLIILGKNNSFTNRDYDFVSQALISIGMGFESIFRKIRIESLLQKTKQQKNALNIHRNELKDANRHLVANLKRLEELDELKNEFLGMASHDLRTPLTVVKGNAELLRDDLCPDTECRKYAYKSIISAANKMLELIDNLLSINQIETGKLKIEKNIVLLDKFILDILSYTSLLAKKKSITLAVDMPSGGIQVLLDTDRISQVLTNFLSNAIKYSPLQTEVTLKIELEEKSLKVLVSDQGVGIPDDEHDKVFLAFSKISSVPTAGEHSTGLGLTICKKIIDNHGGEIGFSSEKDQGSTFYFILHDCVVKPES